MFNNQPDNTRTVILTKHNILGIFSLAVYPHKIRLVTTDPRQRMPSIRDFSTPEGATAVFKDHLNQTLRNGWTITYDGPRLHG